MIEHLNSEPAVPARVVIIGATGFVGQDLVREVTDSNVRALPLSSADIDLIKPDSVDKLHQTIAETDSLVIVSAITPDKGKDINTLMRNLEMGRNLSAFLEETICSHVVYISSDAVYADDANPVRENSCCDPSSFHGLMHLVRERMFASAAQKEKTPLVILRPTSIYGANDTHNSYGPNRFLRTALTEHQIKLFGQGEEKRDHVYVKDLSRLASLCLARRSRGVLNVATGDAISFFDLATMIAGLCVDHVEIEGSPRANPITHRHFDIAATYQAFPEFRLTSLQDGLAETFRELP